MKITVLRKVEYCGTYIHIMQFGFDFQFLFPYDNEIHQNHVTIRPRLINIILWKLGRIETPYTREELDTAEQVILSAAMDTLDKIT